MSVPFFYNGGPGASAEMKRDLARVRNNNPSWFNARRVKEKRVVQGKEETVTVWQEPRAAWMSPRQRHELCDAQPISGRKIL